MTSRPGGQGPVALAIVHHANQYLIADGYDNRQGLAEIVDGYTAVLRLHERYGVPAGLHLSGTLVEAIAWGRPDLLDLVRGLVAAGVVRLIGGTYAENVMPLFDAGFNRRQLAEAFAVYEELLGCPPAELRTCWIPERVWDTGALARVLADATLGNGGYERVLVDDRLLFPVGESYPGSAREAFDARGPYAAPGEPAPAEACRPCRIAGGAGLVACPISANLRYWVPPHAAEQERLFGEQVRALAGAEGTLLVYGDDMEKTAGVAGWQVEAARFEGFLASLTGRSDVASVHLDLWLDEHPPAEERALEAGTFYELAQAWGAGEDYRGWAEAADWLPYQELFERSRTAVEEAEAAGADPGLLRLAWKHVLAAAHETAWRDPAPEGEGRAPAPWSRALASHARHARAFVVAARRTASASITAVRDVDGDGEDEVLLAAGRTAAVFSPRHGGRLLLLAEGGRLSVGNPTDHWNFQEELNRFMDVPPNHPGALADEGAEHDEHWIVNVRCSRRGEPAVELVNAERGSHLEGARKSAILLRSGALAVRYELRGDSAATTVCLSPDYEGLLRRGREELGRYDGSGWRGWRNREACVWVALDDGEAEFGEADPGEVGHGLDVRVEGHGSVFHLAVGWGETDEARCRALLAEGRAALEAFRRGARVFDRRDATELERAYGISRVRLLGYVQGNVARLDSDRGPLALRRLRSAGDVRARHRLAAHLAAHGVPVPMALQTRAGDTVVDFAGEAHDLTPWAPGARRSRLSEAEGGSAGETLARFHEAGAAFPGVLPKRGFAAGLREATESVATFEVRPGDNGPTVAAEIESLQQELDWLRATLLGLEETLASLDRATLPQAIVHGDYRRSNLLFSDGAVSAVLDLDGAARDARMTDVAVGLSSLARSDEAFLDPALARALVAGYRSLVHVEREELAALPELVVAAFARSMLVHVRDGNAAERAAKLAKHGDRLRRLLADPSWQDALR